MDRRTSRQRQTLSSEMDLSLSHRDLDPAESRPTAEESADVVRATVDLGVLREKPKCPGSPSRCRVVRCARSLQDRSNLRATRCLDGEKGWAGSDNARTPFPRTRAACLTLVDERAEERAAVNRSSRVLRLSKGR